MTRTRRVIQGGFLILVLYGVFVLGANCERWCPFGGIEAIYTYATEGNMLCSLGVSNFFILGGVLALTLLTRRAFCGYLCPIGTISEWLRVGARRARVRGFAVSPRLDRLLSALKYVVLVLILVFTYRAGELVFRGYDPCYALIGRHGEDITPWAYIVSGGIVLASLAVMLPFCRWFCPLAAVLNGFSRFGWARVQRDRQACRDCGLCARECPMAIPVDRVEQVTAPRCISCLRCVEVCPTSQAGALYWGPRFPRARRWSQATLTLLLLSCTLGAVAASYLIPIPSFVKQRGTAPVETAQLELRVNDLTCRGRASLFAYFLEREDIDMISGYLHIAAWPGSGWARVVITYDPAQADETAIKQAITNPIFEPENNFVRSSPFEIEGYDPLDLEL